MELFVHIVGTFTVGCDIMQIQKFLLEKAIKKGEAYCLTDVTNDTPSKMSAVQYNQKERKKGFFSTNPTQHYN